MCIGIKRKKDRETERGNGERGAGKKKDTGAREREKGGVVKTQGGRERER